MKRTRFLVPWLCLCWAGLTSAAPVSSSSTAATKGTSVAKAAKRPMVAPARASAKSGASVKPKPSAPAKTSAKSGVGAKPATGTEVGTRQLQDIHIEGEIPVPQVLFITAREQRRFMDFQHRRYLRTSQEVGEQAVFPTRIAVVGQPPMGARKETSP